VKPFRLTLFRTLTYSPYRNQGLASKLMHHLLNTASQTLLQPVPEPSTSASSSTPAPTESKSTSAPSTSAPPPLSKKALKKAAQKGKSALPPPVPTVKKDEAEEVDPVDDEKERKKKERAEQEAKRSRRRIEKVSLHVQVGNEDAKKFWEKFGFTVVVSHNLALH